MNLHAATTADGRDRKQLHRLAKYLLRPPFAQHAVTWLSDGRVRLEIAKRNRSVHMTPEQFIAKLIALVPAPGVHMIRYAGIFSNRHHLRRRIAPAVPDAPVVPTQLPLFDVQGRAAVVAVEHDGGSRPRRIAWARLLARVFSVDILACPRCEGRLVATAAVLDPDEIAALLHGARGPPRPSPPGQLQLPL
jgi:hypothetical protein